MEGNQNRIIVVTGATGLQGGAVARQLLADGWQVLALTRDQTSEKAQALSRLGAQVVQGDMDNPESLRRHFEGAYGLFSVQNPILSGIQGEIRQGIHVAEAANEVGIQHLVYSSAGPGLSGTGVPSWESKRVIEDFIKTLPVPWTIVRPTAFMEIMNGKKFFPAVSTWRIMPALMGATQKVAWLSTDDLGVIVSRIFAQPDVYLRKELNLASDSQSISECRALYQEVMGKKPPVFPMPIWMFERFGFIGKDLTLMWRWLRDARIEWDVTTASSIHPQTMRVREWLHGQKSRE